MKLESLVAEAESLFVLPDSVTRLKACMDDSASSIEDMGTIISTDPALATQLLKIANSSLYRFPNKIETIPRALQVVGTRSAYDMALAYGVSHAFKDISGTLIDLDKFWEQSVSCALLAKHLGERYRIKDAERLFVSGLLHNIGELVAISVVPEQAKKCLKFNKDITPANLQHAVLGFHYTTLSALLIKKWGLPEPIWQAIRTINYDPADITELEGHILQLAYSLALDNINSDIYPAYSNVNPHTQTLLDLERADLEEALDISNIQCLGILSLFNPTAFMMY
ncbi:HDOD domain-containing protein [Alteromonas sediminis]|uniref:HDOD domain-containing protein n=1 Tax=Alteromonas sediminis TaxID=2259342 RepID=A0A3N5Z8P3_9ALTE|nr:HDOD domain-containing protein [Alteromonas sediminis]RPJ67264.1 HDOD domain-containing protein [Alteromonas sediminis]